MRKAENSGVVLTKEDAEIIKGMLARGDRQHDIASWFGVNPGRIAEIKSGELFPDAVYNPPMKIPPPGPYRTQSQNYEKITQVRILLRRINNTVIEIEDILKET